MTTTRAAEIRAGLDHPIIDADGHYVEIGPILHDEIITYLEDHGGVDLRDRYLAGAAAPIDTAVNLSDRGDASVRHQWRAMPSWWGWQARNTYDRASMHLPHLLYERLDEFALDYALIYPSMSLSFLDLLDHELAAVLCKAVNEMHARTFAPFADRMTIGALLPMSSPDVAIAGLEHAVSLGFKTAVIAGGARRPIGAVHDVDPKLDPVAYRIDTFGLDSDHDYDPFWTACIQHGISPVTHSSLQAHRPTRSISNYVYNHVGGLAAMHESLCKSLCKSLFLGGVTHRFPELRVGFLEGGVGWACSLFADLVGHWDKRNANEIGQLDPDTLDVAQFMKYVDEYGTDEVRAKSAAIEAFFSRPAARPTMLDEFEPVHASSKTDLHDKFVPRFFFGCEADDPLITWAFRDDINPVGARMQPLFGSDISHWDVPDMTEPVEEAYELVEHGLIDEGQFREFMFDNAIKLHASTNPRFFEGTSVEQAAAKVIARI